MKTKGIDISYCQRSVDYKKAKNDGVEFAIIRSGYRQKTDDMLYKHLEGCIKAGIKYGVYVYAVAMNKEEAKAEAQYCLDCIKNYSPEYPIFYDLEDSRLEVLSKSEITDIAKSFLEEIKNANYYPALYANPLWMETHLQPDKLKEYDFWLAAWTGDPKKTTKYDYGQKMWQWGLDYVAGIGEVDGNLCYTDYPSIIKAGGFNKVKIPQTPKIEPVLKTENYIEFKNIKKYYKCLGKAVKIRKYPSNTSPITGVLEKGSIHEVTSELYQEDKLKWLGMAGGFSMYRDQIDDILFIETVKANTLFKFGDKVKIVGKYAGAASSDSALNSASTGAARYIVRILKGAKFPYQLGMVPGDLTSQNTTGYADDSAIIKI